VKRTIKNYCFNPTQSKLNELYEIGYRYAQVKNDVFHRYGSISGLQHLSYPRHVRDEWIKTGYTEKFGLQARYWKLAFDEAFANIKSNWSNAINKAKKNLSKNDNFTKEQKHYAFYLFKAKDLLYKMVKLKDFVLPSKFHGSETQTDKIHKYLKNRLRKHIGTKPYQKTTTSFQLDQQMYDTYRDTHGRLWLGIMGLTPRKRIRLCMTSSVEPKGTIRVVLRDKTIEIHHTEDIQVNQTDGTEQVAIDKGFTHVLTSSSGKKYGEGFNTLLKTESDRLSEKNKIRNKLYALVKKHEDKGNVIKAEQLKQNNLGKKKYINQKKNNREKLKHFINLSLNKFFTAEKPVMIGVESLTFTNWNKKLPKKIKRYFSSWLKGYLQERISFKAMLNGVQQVVVNAAYGSQVCHLCGHFGVRRGDKFHCGNHGVLDADHNAAVNYLARMSDHEITVYTPYRKVKDILQERLRLSNQDFRNPSLTGQSKSERAEDILLCFQ
jgi:hypothetical protein